MRQINLIIVHCSATPPTRDIGAKEIREWHVKQNGWRDIGYHYVIRRNGDIETGRDTDHDGDIFEEVGSHTQGYNKNSLGICMVGGVDKNMKAENNFTAAQFASLERLLRIIRADYPKATIHGHNEYSSKACPSFDVQEWLAGRSL